jgi:transposase InsO family protein
VRGCVLAGVWGAGKTSVYQRTVARLVKDGCQSLVSMPQAATITTHTYAPGQPHQHAANILSWLENLTTFLEEIDRRFQASTLPTHRFAPAWTPTCVLEGLGFDAPLYGLPLDRADVRVVERRLGALGLHLVFLRVPDHRVRAQCVESTRLHRGPKWARYLDGFGSTDAVRAKHIKHAQDELMRWAQSSPLPLCVIDTTAQDWDTYARQVADLITA